MNDSKDQGSGLSRRDFLQGSSVAAAATALGAPTLPGRAAQPGGNDKAPPAMGPIPGGSARMAKALNDIRRLFNEGTLAGLSDGQLLERLSLIHI